MSDKRKYGATTATDPEHIVMSEFLRDIGEVDEHLTVPSNEASRAKRQRIPESTTTNMRPRRSTRVTKAVRAPLSNDVDEYDDGNGEEDDEDREDDGEDELDEDDEDTQSDKAHRSMSAASRHTKLTELEQHVRQLERDNLHLKQTLLLGKQGSMMLAGTNDRDSIQQTLAERTKIVQEMVEHLNGPFLSLGEAARVWHQDCRVGVGVREWDAFGRLETISLWNMIRSVFATMAVDIVELRPHLPDGEMILTKWRIQGEIASPAQLESVCASEDCPPTMKVALMAIKSSDLTFTVTTYVIFQEAQIAEQHHCWDQVGVFKRLFGGEIPPSVLKILAVPQN